MGDLTISDRRERAIVAAADAALWPVGAIRRAFTASRPEAPGRILFLRLERIGDLLMTLPALAELRTLAPDATIDLVVGSWNADLAATVSSVDRIETLDARWLARGRDGHALPGLLKRARGWARYRYDLASNFEPAVRSNLLLAVTGARRLVGFASGGGGPLLDLALPYDPREHTTDNAVRLVRAALGGPTAATARPHLRIPEPDREEAARLLSRLSPGPRIAIHVSAGRAVKQWPEARFAQVASRLIADRGASIVLTGATEDRAQVDQVRLDLPADRVIDLSGAASLTRLAALLERVSLIVTGDPGPMHLPSLRCSVHRIRYGLLREDRWIVSSVSTFRVPPATASAFLPRAARGIRRTAWSAWMSRWCFRPSMPC